MSGPRRAAAAALLACLVPCSLVVARARAGVEPRDGAEIARALRRAQTVGSALYVAAHPDDENTALLSYLVHERGLRAAYLSVTRGDGGQNLIGTEQGPLLGVLRTQELLAARRIDGAEQWFTQAIDFGYSKGPEETLAIWGEDAVLADVVWVLRRMRPDVIVARFPADGGGGHGHHTASAILAARAFDAAGDPERFPEQLAHVEPFRPRRLFWNRWSPPGREAGEGAGPILRVDIGGFHPLLGLSYTELAGRSRSMHKSQGFGSAERRGSRIDQLQLLAGDAPEGDDFLSGIDTTWGRIPGGAAVGASLAAAEREFDPWHPERIVPRLLDAWRAMAALPAGPLVDGKREELRALVKAASGLWVEAVAERAEVSPGASVGIAATAIVRGPVAATLRRVELPFGGGTIDAAAALTPNKPFREERTIAIPETTAPTAPHWLAEPPEKGRYRIADLALSGLPELPPSSARFLLAIDGTEIAFDAPVVHRWTDPVEGEHEQPIEVVPRATVRIEDRVVLFAGPEPRATRVRIDALDRPASGTLLLHVPEGWTVEPSEAPFSIAAAGGFAEVRVTVTPPRVPGVAALAAEVVVEGAVLDRERVRIRHPHVPPQTILPRAESKLVRADVAVAARTLGYVEGPGDEVAAALEQMGVRVERLSDADLATGDLARFDAIVTGVRAWNTRDALDRHRQRLLDWVAAGGTLVCQYCTSRGLGTETMGPFPFQVSRDRVTVEEAPVRMQDPPHRVLLRPNRIDARDFEGWVQERGLYFGARIDERYETPLAMADPGEEESRGSLLVARHGKGLFVYTGLSFFRQLPAGVPGAYRLFANLVSGRNGDD